MNMEIIAIVGTGIGVVGFLYSVIRNFRSDFDSKFEKSEQRWIETNARMDKRINEINNRMDGVYHILLKRIKEE